MYVLLLLLSRLRPVYLENSLEAVRQISTDNLNSANFVKTGLVEVAHPQGERRRTRKRIIRDSSLKDIISSSTSFSSRRSSMRSYSKLDLIIIK